MAHHKSAKKRIRQTERRTAVNRLRVGPVRASIKNVETAITSGDKTAAVAALREAQAAIMRGVSKGLVHRNTAARKVSRISSRIKAMA